MSVTASRDVTHILSELSSGNAGAFDKLFPMIYDELKRVARRQLYRSPSETVNTTALVHEAYAKMVGQAQPAWQDRHHFYGVAARAMRQILTDYARKRSAEKRGSAVRPELLDERMIVLEERASDVLALDEALTRLAKISPRLASVVELRFFGGLSVEETAVAMKTSTRTIKRDWRKARAILTLELQETDPLKTPSADESAALVTD